MLLCLLRARVRVSVLVSMPVREIEYSTVVLSVCPFCFFFQAEDGIRDLVRSRGLGDVYKRQQPT